MFVDMFPAKLRTVWLGVIHVIELAVCALFSYGALLKLQNFMSTGTTTDVLNMPKWPFALACLIGFAELTILVLMDLIQLIIDAAKNKPEIVKKED
jgi:TRAP-type C4-dicarboxylate transport system permease small subunit